MVPETCLHLAAIVLYLSRTFDHSLRAFDFTFRIFLPYKS